MKTNQILTLALAAGLCLASCKKTVPQPAMMDSTAAVAAQPSSVDEYNKWKADAQMRIKSIEDSIDAYSARYKGPKFTAAMKQESQMTKAQLVQLRAEMEAQKDEATGSWKRAGEAIDRSLDTIGTRVSRTFSGK